MFLNLNQPRPPALTPGRVAFSTASTHVRLSMDSQFWLIDWQTGERLLAGGGQTVTEKAGAKRQYRFNSNPLIYG